MGKLRRRRNTFHPRSVPGSTLGRRLLSHLEPPVGTASYSYAWFQPFCPSTTFDTRTGAQEQRALSRIGKIILRE